jgi:hypothetical protein
MNGLELSSISTVSTLQMTRYGPRLIRRGFVELTAEDILNVSPKYWEFHTDPILTMDGSVGTLLTIHYNLAAGTLAMFARGRPEVQRSLQRMLTFQTSYVSDLRLGLATTSDGPVVVDSFA